MIGDDLRPLRHRRFHVLQRDRAVRLQRNIFQRRARRLGRLLPRNQVAVMLHRRNDDLVAFAQRLTRIAGCYDIQCRRRSARENNLPASWRVQEPGDLLPRPFVSVRRPRPESMNAAMHVGVIPLVVPLDRFDDGTRLLRSRRVIQVYERMTVYILVQNRKFRSRMRSGPYSAQLSFQDAVQLLAQPLSDGISDTTGSRNP